jgi:hypothetical protein
MSKITLEKWKQIGRICGYDGNKSASVWSEKANKLRKSCSYEMWKKIAQSHGYHPYDMNSGPSQEAIKIMNIIDFLGREITDDQSIRLMDRIRDLGVDDKMRIKNMAHGRLYTLMSENEGEMGGYDRY